MHRRSYIRTVLYITSALLLLLASPLVGHAESTAQKRAERLKHGINIGSIGTGVVPECCANSDNSKPADEIKTLKQMGFDHVRLGIQLLYICDCKTTGNPKQAELKHVLDFVRTVTDQGMPIIVSIRLKDAQGTVEFDLQKAGYIDNLTKFWGSFSSALGQYPHDLVFPEVVNEPYERPGMDDELTLIEDWVENQQLKLVDAIRRGASDLTIIATGARGSTIYGLLWLDLKPLHDDNVIYSFHYYQPDDFAHHGRGRYPSPVLQLIQPAGDVREQLQVQNFAAGGSYWGQSRVSSEIDAARAWYAQAKTAVICDEFGVKKTADGEDNEKNQQLLDDRVVWITDVRSPLDRGGIGWTFWDYRDCTRGETGCGHDHFGLVDETGQPDKKVLKALDRKTD